MASGKKGNRKPNAVKAARGSAVGTKNIPWGTIIAVVAIVLLAGGVFGYYYVASSDSREQKDREQAAAEQFTPSKDNPDPSTNIRGVQTAEYQAGAHVLPNERVAYDQAPPFGGPHDGFWASCTGTVYDEAVRNENMVHALEHGAVWIAYDPEQVKGEDLEALRIRVENKPFMMLSPYPNLDKPVSLQSWGHQLKVDDVDDERIDQFIAALKRNANTYPEVGASCDALGPGQFDPENPPKFDPSEPGKDAKPMDYQGSQNAVDESMGGGQ
ncbi:DUF3105 domain-containing protein [Prauserella rugosa]|uniref:Uncharacterized protein DUF3105 n=1 Tax=Prauserella rugosa TaxID=43354 RepID=A0A660CFK2_9PSEU|nr:DUF3105 domain-containing protein [Prauserella rugosa]KMS92334.1 membrane protein [Streptomyces regensis]TWH20299.1 uncharacterized protein DUF3105 [Prauserella rugosa]